jgi:hypothetical protein
LSIPTPGETIRKSIVEAERPAIGDQSSYEDRAGIYRFFRDTYTGGGAYAPSTARYSCGNASLYDTEDSDRLTYLEPHWREEQADFRLRAYRAHYKNYAKHKVIDPIVGLLTKRPPDRTTYPDGIKDWIDDIGNNQGFDLWLKKEALIWGLSYGHIPVLISNDPHTAITKAQQEAEGAKEARLAIIHPDAILDWEIDLDGNYLWIKIKEERADRLDAEGNPSPRGEQVLVTRWTWITQEGWYYCDVSEKEAGQEIPVLASGVWPDRVLELKKPPLAHFKRGSESTSLLASISSASRRMYNQDSEKASIMRGQAFSILCIPAKGGKAEIDQVNLGIENALAFPDESKHAPFFLTPESGPIEAYERASDLEKADILEQANMSLMEGKGALAAATAAYLWQKTNAMLCDISADIESFEYEIMELVCAWKGIDFSEEARANWPDDFGAIDVERELENAGVFLNLAPGQTAEKAARMRATKTYLPDESEEFYSDVEKELEEEAEAQADLTPEDELAAAQAELQALNPKPPKMPEAETK